MKKGIAYWKIQFPKRLGMQDLTKDEWALFFNIFERYYSQVRYSSKNLLKKLEDYYYKFYCRKYKILCRQYMANTNDKNVLKEHVDYLCSLFEYEKKRQDKIDAKGVQIITNIGFLFTIIAFTSSFILSRDNYLPCFTELSIFLAVLSLIFSLVSLIKAFCATNFKGYKQPMHDIIFDKKNLEVVDFYKDQIYDFTISLISNKKITNQKTSKIISANKFLKFSFIMAVVFSISNLSASYLNNSTSKKASVEYVRIVNTVDCNLHYIEKNLIKKKKLQLTPAKPQPPQVAAPTR